MKKREQGSSSQVMRIDAVIRYCWMSSTDHELLNFDPQSSLRDFLNTHQDEISYIEADASVLQDLDTPQDYQRFSKDLIK